MRKREMKKFEGLLNSKIDRLVDNASRPLGGQSLQSPKMADPNDRATLEADRNFTLRIRDRERKLILKARKALRRIQDGTYGYCEVCGEPIDKPRLMARPEASLCIDCKTEVEDRERRARAFR